MPHEEERYPSEVGFSYRQVVKLLVDNELRPLDYKPGDQVLKFRGTHAYGDSNVIEVPLPVANADQIASTIQELYEALSDLRAEVQEAGYTV